MGRFKVAVVGDGTVGAELIRRLSTHPGITLGEAGSAGTCDVVFLAEPRQTAALELPPPSRIIDLTGASRDELVRRLPELDRGSIRRARVVCPPGGFATAIALALAPLARARMLSGPTHVVGIGPTDVGEAPLDAGFLARVPLEHADTLVIEEMLRRAGSQGVLLRFARLSSALGRGVFATSFVEITDRESEATIEELYRAFYADEPFVRLVVGRSPDLETIMGSNVAEIGFALGEPTGDRRPLAVFSALDERVKGGAGQAIQCMNLMLGLPETTGVDDAGAAPAKGPRQPTA